LKTFVTRIPVEDASGAQFEIYEWREPSRFFGGLLPTRHFELDTGEPAELVDDNTFRLLRTGEAFVRAAWPQSA
jgi:hypothetical protein